MLVARLWHQVGDVPWGVWIAAVVLILGLGTFLDENYVGTETRNKAREKIAKALKRLEDAPSKLRSICEALPATLPFLWGLMPLAVYWVGRQIPGNKYKGLTDLIVSFALVTMIFYSFMLLPLLVLLVLIVISLAAATTFFASKFLLWIVFKPAANPDRSPFKFITSMAGIWVLLAKLIAEVMNHK